MVGQQLQRDVQQQRLELGLAAADAALYLAKQAGRNQTRVATGGVPTPLAQAVPAARPAPSA